MSEPRVIKRYANRKLYDTQHSRYVTLEQIADMIRNGDDVNIVDNKTKEDLTSVTLAQIIFEEEKKQKSFLPLQTMRNIIETGGESISQFVTQAQRRVTNILPKKGREDEEGGLEGAEGTGEEAGGASEEDEEGRGKARDGLSGLGELREWILHSQQVIDEWQRRVDGRVRHLVEGISTSSPLTSLQDDVQGLASRIAELEQKLSQLAARSRQKLGDATGERSSSGGKERSEVAPEQAPEQAPGQAPEPAPGAQPPETSEGDDAEKPREG